MKDKEPWEVFAELEQGVPYIKEETNDNYKEDNKNVQEEV